MSHSCTFDAADPAGRPIHERTTGQTTARYGPSEMTHASNKS